MIQIYPNLGHFGNQHEYTEIAMNYDVESHSPHSHCSQPGPRCDFNSQIQKQEVIWACICFPLVCPIEHAIDISLLQWDQQTYQYVRPMMHRQNKNHFLEPKEPRSTKTYDRTKPHYFPQAINLRNNHHHILWFFKFQKLEFGLGKAARTSKTRGLQRLGSRDQGQREHGMI